jgi:S1-C subfamily serine protease
VSPRRQRRSRGGSGVAGTLTGQFPVDVPGSVTSSRSTAALVVVGACIVAGCGGGSGDAPGRAARAPALVRVVAGAGAARDVATGVVVGDGRVLTVAHALDGARRVRVAVPGTGDRRARVLARSARLDVALLAVDGVSARRVSTRPGRAGDHASLWVLRDGAATALAATVRRPITAHVRAQPGDAPQVRPGLELAAAIEPGDSGAPLVDAEGRMLGLAFAQAGDGSPRAYAVSGEAAVALAGR